MICAECLALVEAVTWIDEGTPDEEMTLYPCGHSGAFITEAVGYAPPGPPPAVVPPETPQQESL